MKLIERNRRGMSSIEFVSVLSAVGIFAAAGAVVLNRVMQAKVYKGAQALAGIKGTIDLGGGAGSAQFDAMSQYHNYAQNDFYKTVTGQGHQTHITGDGLIREENVTELTARTGSSKQMAAKTGKGGTVTRRSDVEKLWE